MKDLDEMLSSDLENAGGERECMKDYFMTVAVRQ